MWAQLKTLIIKKPKNEIKEIIFDNIRIIDPKVIANKFNNYFVNSVDEIRRNIPNVPYTNHIDEVSCKFAFKKITLEDLFIIIKSMNNKKDIYFLSTSVLIDCYDLIGQNLLVVINMSIECGEFPEEWKQSTVIPIAKVKGTENCSEFRPVNMITIESKILEKVIDIQLRDYLENNNLLFDYQSGFRNNHSCEALINLTIVNWKIAVHDKKVVIAACLDLKRAFETIDRDILIKKLEKYGVQENELEWFKSYLRRRCQRTRIGDFFSTPNNVSIGVPQGTILGVILFLVYVNDIQKVVSNSIIHLFADDTLVYVVGNTVEECRVKICKDLEKLDEWFKMNKVKLNVEKSKCLCINGTLSINLTINNEQIEVVKSIRYLGIII